MKKPGLDTVMGLSVKDLDLEEDSAKMYEEIFGNDLLCVYDYYIGETKRQLVVLKKVDFTLLEFLKTGSVKKTRVVGRINELMDLLTKLSGIVDGMKV